jgi:hypothetical protein
LLIIGGAAAFANPIIGAGIAAKALFPSLGDKASKLGLNFDGKKLRDRSEKSQVRKPTIRSSQTSTSWRTALTPAISGSLSKPSSPFMRKPSNPSPPISLGLHEGDLNWFGHLRELQETLTPN